MNYVQNAVGKLLQALPEEPRAQRTDFQAELEKSSQLRSAL
ncbi:MAG: hypothetical protein ABIF85_04220 [Nanoarchaeota archaeon]